MKSFAAATLFMLSLFGSGALAGENCKCQHPSGTGPANYRATFFCCLGDAGTTDTCNNANFPGKNNQCSSGGGNCLDSGNFVTCCINHGAPGAFCWD